MDEEIRYLLISLGAILTAVSIYIFTSRWVKKKQENDELDGYDVSSTVVGLWILIILGFGIGIVNLFKFLI